MGFTKTAIKFALPVPKIENMQRFLFIGPHPDDIEIGAGATAARLAAEGKDVCFLICADGRYGDANFPKETCEETVIRTRQKEALCSAEVLGVTDVRFGGLCDGGFYSGEELLRCIAAVVGDFRPDVIFAPDPRVQSECHIDHLNVGHAAERLAYFAPYEGIMKRHGAGVADVRALAFYMTADVNHIIKTTGYKEKQLRAIFDCHLSQYPESSPDSDSLKLYLKLRSAEYGLRKGCRAGEGFRVLGHTQMHCLPECGK